MAAEVPGRLAGTDPSVYFDTCRATVTRIEGRSAIAMLSRRIRPTRLATRSASWNEEILDEALGVATICNLCLRFRHALASVAC